MDICSTGVCRDGTYDPTKSSTFVEYSKGKFQAAYGDNTMVQGDFIQETLSIGGVEFPNLIMGAPTQGSVPAALQNATFSGIVGVSYISGEYVAQKGEGTYPTVLSQMAASGQIATETFSLWLNDLGKNSIFRSENRALTQVS
jgi:hypothetical protein